jgi:hypothetical protein
MKYLSFPLGAGKHCSAGWTKMTEHHNVGGVSKRYVGCVIPAPGMVHLGQPDSPLVSLPPTQAAASTNWSGYEASGGGPYTSVSAEWRVPTIRCALEVRYAATADWVGVGGDTAPQSGTESMCFGGQVSFAWWTNDAHDLQLLRQLPVNPGDLIYSRDWQLAPGLWQYVVADLSTGQRITSPHGVPWNGSDTTAEWIAENPGPNPGPRDLANFGTETFQFVNFSTASAAPTTLQPFDIETLDGSVIAATTGLAASVANSLFSVVYSLPPDRAARAA